MLLVPWEKTAIKKGKKMDVYSINYMLVVIWGYINSILFVGCF